MWFRVGYKENLLSGRVVRLWHRLPRGAVVSLFLEVFKKRADMILRDMV